MNGHKKYHVGRGLFMLLMCFILPLLAFAQSTNAPPFDPGTSPLPSGPSGYWEYGIALVTPIIVWVFARIGPKVPVFVLPLLAPVVGLLLGALTNWLTNANLGWVDMAKAGALAVFIRELTNQLVTKRLSGDIIKTTGAALLMLTLCFGVTGCKSSLESGGAYAPTSITTDANGVTVTNALSAPDRILYESDAAFDFAHSAILSAMEFERDNRQLLWRISPDIKHTLDKLRPQVVEYEKAWAVARKEYIARPTPANLSALQEATAKIRSINAAVATAIPARK